MSPSLVIAMAHDVLCSSTATQLNSPEHPRGALACWLVLVIIFIFSGAGAARSQSTGNTVGVTFFSPDSSPGYTLFGALGSTNIYLVDHRGELIQRWQSAYLPGASAYLLENGHLFRTARIGTGFNIGGSGGRVEEFSWEGDLIWSYNYASSVVRQHHDAIKLPNGNILMVAWEVKTSAEALAAGRKLSQLASGNLWPDHLVEIQPSGTTNGTVVWEWHTWDHLIQDHDSSKANYGVVAEHPELVDLNYPVTFFSDWQHVNGLDYNAELDQIMISVHAFDEIWIIDHSTTTQEAAGHTGGRSGRGGDLLYRWGHPHAYRAGTPEDQTLFGQHNCQWIRPGLPGAGHILVFNNGRDRADGDYSTIDEIAPPVDANGVYSRTPGVAFGPTAPIWSYRGTPPTSFYAPNVSGIQRLTNGNTLICDGPHGTFFEVTQAGGIVWRYVSPATSTGLLTQGGTPPVQNIIFRAPRYAPDFPGFAGRSLRSHGLLELPASYEFVCVDLERAGTQAVVRWKSQVNRSYLVQFRSDFTASSWADIGTTVALGTEATFVDADPLRVEADSGFYRAMLLPQ